MIFPISSELSGIYRNTAFGTTLAAVLGGIQARACARAHAFIGLVQIQNSDLQNL